MCNNLGDGTPRRELESYIWVSVRGVIKTIAIYKKQEKQHLRSPPEQSQYWVWELPTMPRKGINLYPRLMVALSPSNPVWEIESTLKQLLRLLPMLGGWDSPAHCGECFPAPSDPKGWWEHLKDVHASGAQAERRADRASSLQAKPVLLFSWETWGQLELRQQTKSFTSFRAASPAVPKQGI